MTFIPKGDVNDHGASVQAKPDELRPLSLSNTDQKLLALAANQSLVHACSVTVESHQRGFMKGRLLTDNVLELDAHVDSYLMCRSTDICVAQVLLDMKAAFPSAAWNWIWFVLDAMGAPAWIKNCFLALYVGSSTQLVLGRCRGLAFFLSSGIKQGCPKSGSLWCLLFDPIFRAIRETMSDVGGHASAFADDVGLALPDVIRGLRQLVILLDQVGAASGLHLNWTKTVLLNFSKFSDFQVRRKLEESVPLASGILIQSSGKYLGYLVGPSAATKVWDKPSSKFLRRVRHVRGLGLSLFETSIAFGVFAFSVLRFTLQLVSVSTALTSMYGIALDIVTGTPRYAYGASILCHLQTLGFPPSSDFPNLPLVSRATAYRTAIRSHVISPLCGLVAAARDSDDAYFLPRHRDWAEANSLSYLLRVKREVEAIPAVPSDDGQRHFQGILLKFLKTTSGSGELRATLIRRAIHYGFRLPELLVDNFVTNLNAISSVLPPCVLASVLRTVCNAWTTSRRFRDEHPHCRLGCQAVGGDDVRHYAFCPVFLHFVDGTSSLSDCLWARSGELSFFMLMQETGFEDMVRTAVWVDVLLQGVNWMRLHSGEPFSERVFHSRLRATLARAPAAGLSVFPG